MSAETPLDSGAVTLRPTGTWEEAIDEILYGLYAVDRYSLAVVVGPDDHARRALAAELAARHPERAIFREFRVEHAQLNPFEDFARARQWRTDYITLVYGFEGLSHDDLRKSLRLMNWNRGMLQRGELRVLLWVPAQLEEIVLEHASDLIDWWTVYVALPQAPAIRAWDEPAFDIAQRLRELEHERKQRHDTGADAQVVSDQIIHLRRTLRSASLGCGDILAGRYRLWEQAGSGGFATVWKAWDQADQVVVAVKVLHGQWSHDRSRVERFVSGARRMDMLRHPAIVPVLDAPEQDGPDHFFVMPWLEGGDLDRAVRQGDVDRHTALAAVARVSDALAYAHPKGVVHRDVKPANILLDAQGSGWLTDFDLAWARDETHGTRTGGLGTFVYAAPEQHQDASRVDARADVYSVGMCVLFALAANDPPPFVSKLQPELFAALACGERLRRAVRAAVAYEANERPATCNELTAAIREELELPPALMDG